MVIKVLSILLIIKSMESEVDSQGFFNNHVLLFQSPRIRSRIDEKVQHKYSERSNFFCDLRYGARSHTVPKDIHKLTPGDIDVVAALGDSLTVGLNANARNLFHIGSEDRGVSWSIGGQDTWRQILTLPNILKAYNPKLYGYSLNDSPKGTSGFNFAVTSSMSSQTVNQAKHLVTRMINDRNVDVQKQWKLITYMTGANDFCSGICRQHDTNVILNNAARDLITTLRILKAYLPRTLVNVVFPPNVNILTKLKNAPLKCGIIHTFACPCLFNPTYASQRERILRTIKLWKERIVEVVQLPEFHDSEEFEVNVHPFLDKADLPRLQNGNTDMSYLSPDCFHFTPKGHALLTNALWNSMLTPENHRSRSLRKEFEDFKCPTASLPYLATSKNIWQN
ncbi:unnamed protein product [Chironomus riparius]|uniref:Phospholipase B1, membrane-associated n=1 Tax=Chironomus riparius TaxID=315576 RepID=A0A9N9RVC7_9DIPT|nr:unnamed protein product [Chironomus riparius]